MDKNSMLQIIVQSDEVGKRPESLAQSYCVGVTSCSIGGMPCHDPYRLTAHFEGPPIATNRVWIHGNG